MDRVMNSMAYQEMRRMDARFYTVLALRSFNRGPPMLPASGEDAEDSTTFIVAAGQTLGSDDQRPP
eukprot:Skav212240  [mRNA]  locus=scaffold4106:96064:96854:+ [translate_table: standard]